MKERPILFSGPMVRAILEERKTQTRRIAPITDLRIKAHDDGMVTWAVNFSKPLRGVLGSHTGGRFTEGQANRIIASQFCPYGVPGDRLWVRETFTACWGAAVAEQRPGARRIESGAVLQLDGYAVQITPSDPVFAFYRADGDAKPLPHSDWTPSIFMPRWACRLVLEISDVRVQRLQEISEEDALAEGVALNECSRGVTTTGDNPIPLAIAAYAGLWDSLNAKRGHAWESNPWVWAITFRRVP